MSGCIFSDQEYSAQISIKTYLLTKKQVADVFKSSEVHQKAYSEMYNEEIYLVNILTNKGNKGAWGELDVYVDNEFKDEIIIKLLGANQQEYFVKPYHGIINYSNTKKPNIKTYWENLKTK
jgi:hypothetical protein